MKELYYLPDDIGESKNIYAKRPDVIKRFTNAATALDADLGKNTRPVAQLP